MAERYYYWHPGDQAVQRAAVGGNLTEVQNGEQLERYLKMPPVKKSAKKHASFSVKKGSVSFESRVAKGKQVESFGVRQSVSQVFW